MSNTNTLHKIRGYDYKKIISPKSEKQVLYIEDGKGLHYGGSYGTKKSVPIEDDGLTEYETAKILRKTIVDIGL